MKRIDLLLQLDDHIQAAVDKIKAAVPGLSGTPDAQVAYLWECYTHTYFRFKEFVFEEERIGGLQLATVALIQFRLWPLTLPHGVGGQI